jgi:hypothetical protein
LRALDAAGFRDVRILDYDWRAGYEAGAEALARLLESLPEPACVLAISTGGGVAGRLAGSPRIRRIVYVGAPQLGSFDALACLQRGFRFAPLGKHFPGRDAALCQTTFDALSQWDVLGGHDLYDASVWRELRLCEDVPGLAQRLESASRLRRQPIARHDAVVIGACNVRTPARAVISGGIARMPLSGDSDACFEPGDGSLGETSLRGLPFAGVRLVRVRAHARLPAHAEVHRHAIEALSMAGEEGSDAGGRVQVAARGAEAG